MHICVRKMITFASFSRCFLPVFKKQYEVPFAWTIFLDTFMQLDKKYRNFLLFVESRRFFTITILQSPPVSINKIFDRENYLNIVARIWHINSHVFSCLIFMRHFFFYNIIISQTRLNRKVLSCATSILFYRVPVKMIKKGTRSI